MSNEQKWSLLWNHDVQFGFVCGAFAGVASLILIFFALDAFARIVTGSRKQPQRQPIRGGNGGRGQ
jgi:hypothetical protein